MSNKVLLSDAVLASCWGLVLIEHLDLPRHGVQALEFHERDTILRELRSHYLQHTVLWYIRLAHRKNISSQPHVAYATLFRLTLVETTLNSRPA
jgi:hypothetical protein